MKKRILTLASLLALVAIVSTTMGVLAFAYRATYTISENGTAAYTMYPAMANSNNQWMIDNGFITDADALDTRIETLGGLVRPHMITENMTLTAVAVPLASQTNLYFSTGNSLLANFYIITGRDGHITTADDPALELGDNFSVGIDGWVDTTLVGDNLTYKEDAFRTYISATGNITSTLSLGGVTNIEYDTGDDSDPAFSSTLLQAQTFTTGNAAIVTGMWLKLLKVGAPTNTISISINATVAQEPKGVEITSTTILGSTLDTTPGSFVYIDVPDAVLAGETLFGIVVYDDTAAEESEWRSDAAAPTYADGKRWFSNDSGATWTDVVAQDFMFRVILEAVAVTASGVASGEHTIETSANTTNIWIDIDGVREDIAITMAVPDSANSTLWMQDNTIPYADNITVSVNGTERLRYEPITFIRGSNLPDLTGTAQNGTFTWGTNPSNITVALGSMVSAAQPQPGLAISSPAQDILPEVEVSDWFVEPDVGVGGSLLTNPFRPFITILSDNSTLTEIQSWRLLALALILMITVATARVVRGHHFITGIASGASLGGAVALTIFPFWTLVFVIGAILGGLIAERSPSL